MRGQLREHPDSTYESQGTFSGATHLEVVYAMGMLFSVPICNALYFEMTGYRHET